MNNEGVYPVQIVNNEGTYPIHGVLLHHCTPIWKSHALNLYKHHGPALGNKPASNRAGILHCYPTASEHVSLFRDTMHQCLNSCGMAQSEASQESPGERRGKGV